MNSSTTVITTLGCALLMAACDESSAGPAASDNAAGGKNDSGEFSPLATEILDGRATDSQYCVAGLRPFVAGELSADDLAGFTENEVIGTRVLIDVRTDQPAEVEFVAWTGTTSGAVEATSEELGDDGLCSAAIVNAALINLDLSDPSNVRFGTAETKQDLLIRLLEIHKVRAGTTGFCNSDCSTCSGTTSDVPSA